MERKQKLLERNVMKGKSKFRVWLWGTASVLGGGLGGGTKHRAGGGQRRERAGTPSCRSSTSRAIIPNQNGKQKTKNVNSIFSKTRKLLNPEPQARQEEGQRQQRQRQRVPPGRPCSGSRQQQRRAAGGGRHPHPPSAGPRGGGLGGGVPARLRLARRSAGDGTEPGATSELRT